MWVVLARWEWTISRYECWVFMMTKLILVPKLEVLFTMCHLNLKTPNNLWNSRFCVRIYFVCGLGFLYVEAEIYNYLLRKLTQMDQKLIYHHSKTDGGLELRRFKLSLQAGVCGVVLWRLSIRYWRQPKIPLITSFTINNYHKQTTNQTLLRSIIFHTHIMNPYVPHFPSHFHFNQTLILFTIIHPSIHPSYYLSHVTYNI